MERFPSISLLLLASLLVAFVASEEFELVSSVHFLIIT